MFDLQMKLSFIEPRGELQPYIDSVWVFESPNGLPSDEDNIAAPNGCPKLIFLYENAMITTDAGKVETKPDKKLYFVGNKDRPALIGSSARKTGFIGIEFCPYGAFPISRIPMSETFNDVWEADAFLGKLAHKIQETLNNLKSVEQKVSFLQDQLVLLLRKNALDNRLIEYCVKTLRSADGRLPIKELERKTGYSRRYLDLLFHERVGLPPKVLAGIYRFQKFYRRWANGRSFEAIKEDLYDYYYDQAHFTNEFRKMTGYSPRQYSLEVSNEFGRRFTLR
jgi:AraC-like DNA-binding protein